MELFAAVISDAPALNVPAVIADWDNLAGPLARHVQPTSFDPETGTLSVRTVSATFAASMRLLAPKIVSRLNERLGSDQIRQIRVHVPAAPVRTYTQRTGSEAAPELRDALARQRQASRREPEEHFHAGQEAGAYASRPWAVEQRSAIVRLRARVKPRQPTPTDQPAEQTASGRSKGERHSPNGED
ncbi:DUF721 domain-containing protein [Streptomyces sp. NPDC006864]|uniref:DUF721 domain-containing protein n=1 Tax=Streptomyces sp. NPDC006864 TaxID=3154780 RepID=UPI0034560C42